MANIYNNLKKLTILLVSIITVIGIIYIFDKYYYDVAPSLEEIQTSLNDTIINDIKREISAPGPLINKDLSLESYLTAKGILTWTNIARKDNGSLPPLIENPELDSIAEERLNDLFAKQYFEHVSPESIGASNIAERIGYRFIAIGENLALGNFKDDQAIVDAWMASPGHRANILNTRYKEIGIAVKKDIYEGRKTWIGVQIFALPLSACPEPDKSLKSRIDTSKDRISQMEKSAGALKNEINNTNPQNKKELILYNQKIEEYNSQIEKINNLVSELKIMISTYNSQADLLNKCVSQ